MKNEKKKELAIEIIRKRNTNIVLAYLSCKQFFNFDVVCFIKKYIYKYYKYTLISFDLVFIKFNNLQIIYKITNDWMNNCKFNTKYGMRQNKKFWSKLIVFP